MRKLRTRALSAVLAFGLTVGLLPGFGTGVYAAEEETTGEVVEYAGTDEAEGSSEEHAEAGAEECEDGTGTGLTETAGDAEEDSSDTAEEISGTDQTADDSTEAADETKGTEEVSDAGASGKSGSETADGTSAGSGTASATKTSGASKTASVTTASGVASAARASATSGVKKAPALLAANDEASILAATAAETSKDGWVEKDGVWYFYENGSAKTGWLQWKSKWYYFDSAGVMLTGWLKTGGVTYYLLDSGAMATGWKLISSKWYYFKGGAMLTGWQTIAGEKYYFGSDGAMLSGQWIDNMWLRSEDGTATDEIFSREYMGSPYYKSLQDTLAKVKDEPDIMKRVLAIAQSQEGYYNYAMAGYSVSDAKSSGNLWTGKTKRSNGSGTGNTEYTRWAQRYWHRYSESSQYADYDWCAIFSSWCLFQAGLYTGQDTSKKNWYYSYCADPRVDRSYGSSFNCDQAQVWYTPLASKKIAAYADWNEYVHTEVSPYDIPYRPGGLIFFCWDGVGRFFSHVGIVVSYDEEKHILRYISGNCSGQVLTYDVYYDKTLWSGYTGYNSIMAYAEYYEGREGWKIKNDKLYYYQKGKAQTGWQKIDGRYYYFYSTGEMARGLVTYNKQTYYMNTAGWMGTGWQEIDGARYYFRKNGTMVTGEQEIDGKKYFFGKDGKLFVSGWWNGYQYDDSGVRVTSNRATWRKSSLGWWFGDSAGWYAKSGTFKINGQSYEFDNQGYWVDPDIATKKGVWKHNSRGWWYQFEDGICARNVTLTIKGVAYSFNSQGWWIDPAEKEGTWKKDKNGWWFSLKDGGYARSETIKYKGKYYSFDEEGYWIEN